MGNKSQLAQEQILVWSYVLRHVGITLTILLIPITVIVMLINGQPEAAIASIVGRVVVSWVK